MLDNRAPGLIRIPGPATRHPRPSFSTSKDEPNSPSDPSVSHRPQATRQTHSNLMSPSLLKRGKAGSKKLMIWNGDPNENRGRRTWLVIFSAEPEHMLEGVISYAQKYKGPPSTGDGRDKWGSGEGHKVGGSCA